MKLRWPLTAATLHPGTWCVSLRMPDFKILYVYSCIKHVGTGLRLICASNEEARAGAETLQDGQAFLAPAATAIATGLVRATSSESRCLLLAVG